MKNLYTVITFSILIALLAYGIVLDLPYIEFLIGSITEVSSGISLIIFLAIPIVPAIFTAIFLIKKYAQSNLPTSEIAISLLTHLTVVEMLAYGLLYTKTGEWTFFAFPWFVEFFIIYASVSLLPLYFVKTRRMRARRA